MICYFSALEPGHQWKIQYGMSAVVKKPDFLGTIIY